MLVIPHLGEIDHRQILIAGFAHLESEWLAQYTALHVQRLDPENARGCLTAQHDLIPARTVARGSAGNADLIDHTIGDIAGHADHQTRQRLAVRSKHLPGDAHPGAAEVSVEEGRREERRARQHGERRGRLGGGGGRDGAAGRICQGDFGWIGGRRGEDGGHQPAGAEEEEGEEDEENFSAHERLREVYL